MPTPPGSGSQGIRQAVGLLRSEADRRILGHALGITGIVIACGVLAALSPLLLKSLVDAVAASPHAAIDISRNAVPRCGLAYLLTLIAGRALADLRPFLSGAINQRLHSRLTQRFFDHVLRLPTGDLLKRRSGEMQHVLALASAGSQLAVGHLTGSLLPVLVELVTMTCILVNLRQPALVAVFGGAALIYLAIFSAGARRMAGAAHEVSTCSLEAYALLGEGLAHLETLRCFAAEEQFRRRLRSAGAALEHQWRRLDRLNLGIAFAASMNFAVATAACLYAGADAVARHTMTVGGFVLTTVYMLQMARPLETLGSAARDLSRTLGYLRPLLDLLAQPASPEATGTFAGVPASTATHRCAASVRIENLHFGYDADRPVIRGLDLDVPAGSTTAIVGRSGSECKSSVARLLLRLYAPQQGRILLDGHAIGSIDATTLRGTLVGLVPQETALLHETIADNIALGSPEATLAEIQLAARDAQLAALVDALPNGLDTPVGERGLQLSGGERQRVGIARVLLRRPRLYVLDEPTSMLDSHTEREIQAALRTRSGGATTIVIAHRLSTIVDADQIVVLDEGRVRERGSHRALLAKGGLYAEMWRQQAGASD